MEAVRWRAVLVVTLLAAVAGCGGNDDPGHISASDAGGEAAFCEALVTGLRGDEAALDAALADPPAELAGAAETTRRRVAAGRPESPKEAAALTEILDWGELHCPQARPGDSRRRVAPPPGTRVDGLTFCETVMPTGPAGRDGRYGMVLYGAGPDPYDGPMLGVVWNPPDAGSHRGDGDQEPVAVRGHSGVAAPITVFQQAVLPDLGTVIAWAEGGHAVGLYGRRWPMSRAGELVAIAERLVADGGGFRLPGSALPRGYREVFTGSAGVTSLIDVPSPLYWLHYQGSDAAQVSVYGLQMTEGEFEAFRFFTVGIHRGEVAGRSVLAGNAWGEDGPALMTWREPDGLVVRIVGLGVPLDVTRRLAGAARELTGDEWAALVRAPDPCGEPSVPTG